MAGALGVRALSFCLGEDIKQEEAVSKRGSFFFLSSSSKILSHTLRCIIELNNYLGL
jgi:hypothetical protein